MDINSIIEARIALDKGELTRTEFNTMLRKTLKEQFPHFNWVVRYMKAAPWILSVTGERKSKGYSATAAKEAYQAKTMIEELKKVTTKKPSDIYFNCQPF